LKKRVGIELTREKKLGVSDVAQKWFRAWDRVPALQRSSKQGAF
jgi:hypothetical protein